MSGDLWTVLDAAWQLSRASNGALDVTTVPLVALWREAKRKGPLPLPTAEALQAAKRRVGWRKLRRDEKAKTVELTAPNMRLDLGEIAKGYAANEALKTLRLHGINRVMIEFSGDIVAGAPPPDRAGWSITAALADSAHRHIEIHDAAVSTSGDTEQFIEIDGPHDSHVADPRSGVGLSSRIAVTVIAPNGTVSDGLATTLSILGPAAAEALVHRSRCRPSFAILNRCMALHPAEHSCPLMRPCGSSLLKERARRGVFAPSAPR